MEHTFFLLLSIGAIWSMFYELNNERGFFFCSLLTNDQTGKNVDLYTIFYAFAARPRSNLKSSASPLTVLWWWWPYRPWMNEWLTLLKMRLCSLFTCVVRSWKFGNVSSNYEHHVFHSSGGMVRCMNVINFIVAIANHFYDWLTQCLIFTCQKRCQTCAPNRRRFCVPPFVWVAHWDRIFAIQIFCSPTPFDSLVNGKLSLDLWPFTLY